jgi:hypothetical protein
MLRKIVLRNTSLPIHDQVNQHHTRSIMLRNMIDRVWTPLRYTHLSPKSVFFLKKLNEDIYSNVNLPFGYHLKEAASLTAKPCII